jgi:hypothetical protein
VERRRRDGEGAGGLVGEFHEGSSVLVACVPRT